MIERKFPSLPSSTRCGFSFVFSFFAFGQQIVVPIQGRTAIFFHLLSTEIHKKKERKVKSFCLNIIGRMKRVLEEGCWGGEICTTFKVANAKDLKTARSSYTQQLGNNYRFLRDEREIKFFSRIRADMATGECSKASKEFTIAEKCENLVNRSSAQMTSHGLLDFQVINSAAVTRNFTIKVVHALAFKPFSRP